MKLIFERGKEGRQCTLLPQCDVPAAEIEIPKRAKPLRLPHLSETEISRHYTELAGQVHGVNNGFYPLGSCTMKYNPKVNEEAAALAGFARIHPLQPEHTVQGALEVLERTEEMLCEITGMDSVTMQPAAGAHGEFTGLLLIKAYHDSRGDHKRTKIIVPDSAHGTNPASASMVGYEVVSIPSGSDGCVDLEKLRAAVGDDTAGLMLTNPNTVGLFDKNIIEITSVIHEAGGLNYYDGANLNAVMGIVRPGDMGFDVVHLNLHKTFSTPHGGGGPGSGPVGCKAFLKEFLPGRQAVCEDGTFSLRKPEHSIGDVKSFYGNFLVVVRAMAYILMLGKEGIPEAAQNAVLNANYMMEKLKALYPPAYDETCMHEFVITLEQMKRENGVTAMDIAKSLLDYGIHPPTMYFPLIVHEALMIEPTETESRETLDEAIRAFGEIYAKAQEDPEAMHEAPVSTYIRRPDEVQAARKPVLRWSFPEDGEQK
ncbi:MAG TPA: aminomethyl-transferring glycine dehydrogenase subunit GcvPB [Candidatus Choladousia intestinipullorum]|nr:aminomethyl-transferring glycine dehydrogenase subunit GcvPB [Candidatus Choladousia intestinipullorum]